MAKFETKYFIGKFTLKEYCEQNGYSYSSARNMISSTRKKHSDWSDDKILEDVKERLKRGKVKYFWGTTTLNRYCEENGIVSSTVRRNIKKSTMDSQTVTDEIMVAAIEKARNGRGKYKMGILSLTAYCESIGKNRGSISNGIYRYKKQNPQTTFSDEEIIKMVTEKHREKNAIYFVKGKGETLASYVIKRGYSPSIVLMILP